MMKKTVCLLLSCILTVLCLMGAAAAEGEITVPKIETDTFEVPDNEAMAFLRKMGVGWNLGNTFDAWNDAIPASDEMKIETIWCGAMTTEKMIAAVHDAGFTTMRLPVSWHNHVDADFNISQRWLDRVQEVLDWAYSRGMYVILNTHHDEGEKYFYPSSEHYETSERYITRIWEQLSERFKDYDEHLIFESMNEPRPKGIPGNAEWNYSSLNPACVDAADCINKLNHAFVNTVRASGGNNATRYLMVPGYAASPDGALRNNFVLPEDPANDNKIIVSVHAYTPYSFALQAGGSKQFSHTARRHTRDIDSFMNSLYKKYISAGIPVVIGEFGARDKDGNLQDRVNYAAYYAANATARNMPCCWWDNNAFTGNGENFGLLRRIRHTFKYPEIVEALMTNVQFGAKAQ